MSLITTHPNPSPQNSTFHTAAGVDVPTDGHDIEFMKQLHRHISTWVKFGDGSPGTHLTDEEMEYIKNNMESSLNTPNKTLTRVELGYHFEEQGLQEGDTINFEESSLRSFSRTQKATLNYFKYQFTEGEGITLYKTVGNVPHFNVTNFEDYYSEEKESFVDMSSLTVRKVRTYKDMGEEQLMNLVEELNLGDSYGYGDLDSLFLTPPEYIRVVEVE